MNKTSKADLSLIKRINSTLIINTIREHGRISRADIAKVTGLTRATVTNLTASLIEKGFIKEAHLGSSSGGRKPILLEMDDSKHITCGVYIDSEFSDIYLTNINGKILEKRRITFDKGTSPAEVIKRICEIIKEMTKEKTPLGIGVAVCGLVNSICGVSIFAPSSGWRQIHIVGEFKKHLDFPIYVDNDVRIMTLAESFFKVTLEKYNNNNKKDFVMVHIGDGIGASVVLGGQIYYGSNFGAGEIGHIKVVENGTRCNCGNLGCLETIASEKAFIKRVSQTLGKNVTLDEIISLYRKDDERIKLEVFDEAKYLSIAIANIINMYNPSLIILNGGIVKLGERFISHIDNEVKRRSMPYLATTIAPSLLGDSAIEMGTCALVLEKTFERLL